MTMTIQDDTIGYPRAAWQFWDTTVAPVIPGTICPFVDTYFGGSELIWLKNSATPLVAGNLVVWDNTNTTVVCPNTAQLNRPVAVALGPMAANVYGWFGIGGQFAVASTASVAAGSPVGLTGAGTIGTNSAGKEVLNATSAVASTGTVVKANSQTVLNGTVLTVPNTDGIFVGCAASGTGIAASTVTQINPNGREVTLSVAMTATGTASVTFTYTGFIVCTMDRPAIQGAIT